MVHPKQPVVTNMLGTGRIVAVIIQCVEKVGIQCGAHIERLAVNKDASGSDVIAARSLTVASKSSSTVDFFTTS